MRKLNILLGVCLLLVSNVLNAQNPFESIGKTTKPMLSLSDGRYVEYFNNDSVRQIGSAMVNVYTEQIVAFVDRKEQAKKVHLQTSSRFLSVDPLARQFPFYTPYQYAGNNPISAIDMDGMESFVATKNKEQNYISLSLSNAEDELSVTWAEKDKETNTQPLQISEVSKFVYNVKVDKKTGVITIPRSDEAGDDKSFHYTKFQKEADGTFKKQNGELVPALNESAGSRKENTIHIPGNFGVVKAGWGLEVSGQMSDNDLVDEIQNTLYGKDYDRIDVFVKPSLQGKVYDKLKTMEGIDPKKINFVGAKGKTSGPNTTLEIKFKDVDKTASEIK